MKSIRAAARFTAAAMAAIMLALPCAVFATNDAENAAVEIWVSPGGDDKAAGTKEAPLATIAAARDAVRAKRGGGDGEATVYISAGVYPQTETLSLGAEDGGVTYKADGGEVVIEGGIVLGESDFRSMTDSDAMSSRITAEGVGEKIIVADLAKLGIAYDNAVFTDKDPGLALYFGGDRARIARYPDYADKGAYIYAFHSLDGLGEPDVPADLGGSRFYDKRGRIAKWASIEGAYAAGSFSIDWQQTYPVPIVAYDAESGMVSLPSNTLSAESGLGGRYYYLNVPEELDKIGEYYIDADTGLLYFYAPDNWRDIRITVGACRETVVDVKADGVTFDGITIEGGYDDGIHLVGDGNRMLNCIVRDCGKCGIDTNGCDFLLDGSELEHIGYTALNLRGGDKISLAPSNSTVTNNRFHDFGDIGRVYNGALQIDGNAFYIAHNEFYHAPHTTLTEDARGYVYEYNYIHDVCYESGDAGSIYVGGWVGNGTVYRYNVFKDIVCYDSVYMNPHGIYSDAGGGMRNIYSNIFINIDGYGVYCGGRDIKVLDNIFVDTSIHFDQCGYYPGTGPNAGYTQIAEFPVEWAVPSSIGYNWKLPLLNPKLSGYGTELWSVVAPALRVIKTTNVIDLNDNYTPHAYGDSRIRNNVFASDKVARSTEIFNNIYRLADIRDNVDMTVDSVGFADYAGGDYTLAEDSAVYNAIQGFHALDFSKVGVQK